jgi:hypothetical protein
VRKAEFCSWMAVFLSRGIRSLLSCSEDTRLSQKKVAVSASYWTQKNNIVIGRDQEASERKMCKSNVVDQVRLVYRVRCLLPLK